MSRQVTESFANEIWVALEALEAQRRIVLETKATAPPGVLGRRVAKLIKYEREYAWLVERTEAE